MKIDIASEDGNTLAALTIATTMLKRIGAAKDEITEMRRAVFAAESAVAARAVIEKATNGAITFVDTSCRDYS